MESMPAKRATPGWGQGSVPTDGARHPLATPTRAASKAAVLVPPLVIGRSRLLPEIDDHAGRRRRLENAVTAACGEPDNPLDLSLEVAYELDLVGGAQPRSPLAPRDGRIASFVVHLSGLEPYHQVPGAHDGHGIAGPAAAARPVRVLHVVAGRAVARELEHDAVVCRVWSDPHGTENHTARPPPGAMHGVHRARKGRAGILRLDDHGGSRAGRPAIRAGQKQGEVEADRAHLHSRARLRVLE